MFKRLLTRFSLIAALLGLSACAAVPQGSTQINGLTSSGSITEKVSLGSMIDLPPEGGADGSQARVVDEYFSASGRHCVRVEIKQSSSSTRVICERENGSWSFTRSLFNNNVPAVNNEMLITTPLNGIESNPAQMPELDQSSVADTLGTTFDTRYALLPSYESNALWDFAGTTTAGPASWTEVATASVAVPLDIVVSASAEEPITGRR